MDKALQYGALALAIGAGAWILSSIKPSVNQNAPSSTPLPQYTPPSAIFHGDLDGAPPSVSTAGGSETLITQDQFPLFKGNENNPLNHEQMSLALLKLNPMGVREPHWHLNANEILYCSQGTAAMTIFLGSPNLVHDSFAVSAGDIVFVPKGFFHHIDNIGSIPLKMILAYNNSKLETEGLSGAVGVSGPDLMNKTFGTNLFSLFGARSTKDIGIGLRPPGSQIPTLAPIQQIVRSRPFVPQPTPTAQPLDLSLPQKQTMLVEATPLGTVTRKTNPITGLPISATTAFPTTPIAVNEISRGQSRYWYPLEYTTPAVNTSGGTDTTSDSTRFPILRGGGLAIFSIVVNPLGVREPHWHPNASELHYILSGTTRYFVESPNNQVETGQVYQGQFFWAPTGYLHYFENLDPINRLHVISFFTSDNPQDIGLSGGMSSYSNSVLGATLNQSPSVFGLLPRFKTDKGIIGGFRS